MRSKKAQQEQSVEEARKRFEESNARELAKVRAMTFPQVVEAAVQILSKLQLAVVVEYEEDNRAQLHVCTGHDQVRLGFTTVTKTYNGGYLVGGTSAGCFMHNHSENCLNRVVTPLFRDLEDRANEEKV